MYYVAQPLLHSRVILTIGTAERRERRTMAAVLGYPDKVKLYTLQLQLEIRGYGAGEAVRDVVALAETPGDWRFRGLRLENNSNRF